MIMIRKIFVIACLGLGVVLMVTFGLFSPWDNQALAENDAIVRGLEEARRFGLVGEPTEMTIAKTDMVTYWESRGEEISKYEREHNTEVWVLDIKSEVRATIWGIEEEFSEVVIVLDAKTGDMLSLGARFPGHELKLPGQKVTLDDVGKFPLGQAETPVKPTLISLPT